VSCFRQVRSGEEPLGPEVPVDWATVGGPAEQAPEEQGFQAVEQLPEAQDFRAVEQLPEAQDFRAAEQLPDAQDFSGARTGSVQRRRKLIGYTR
jgi:hypothetical protein